MFIRISEIIRNVENTVNILKLCIWLIRKVYKNH